MNQYPCTRTRTRTIPGAAFVVLLALAATVLAQEKTRTRAPMIQNPVLRGFSPDPSFVRVGEDYYLVTSTFEWFPGVRIHHSRDLVHWQLRGHALTRRSQLDLRGCPCSTGVWAPDLTYHDGKFWLVYTNVRNGRGGFVDAHNYLVTAPAVEGPWSEPVYLNASGFDPALFHDRDGRTWFLQMVWDHRLPKKSGGITLQEYDPVARKLVGKPRLIFEGTEAGGTEAPHIYWRDGWYHLMTAEGGTWFDHVVTMARARRLEGPYELDPGNPVLTSRDDPERVLQKAGHGSLISTPKNEWFLAHLCARPLPGTKLCPLGRETALQRCTWNADGWLRLASGGHHPQVEVAAPLLPPHPFPAEPTRDDFTSRALNPHLNTLREPPDETWLSLTARPGWLRLTGRESLNSQYDVSLVARRLTSLQAEASTCLEFAPESYREMAGLVCLFDNRNYRYLHLSHDEKLGRCLAVLVLDRGRMHITDRVKVADDEPCFLRVRFSGPTFRFFHSRDGKTWQPVGPDFRTEKLSDDYGRGFTGPFVGLTVQDLSGGRCTADFDYLEYRENPISKK